MSPRMPEKLTLVHVTHEATEHLGGIGTVLAGLLTAPAYRNRVARSILIGPLFHADRRVNDPKERLGEHAVHCSYSGTDHHDPSGFGAIFKPIEWALGTKIVYGTRVLRAPGHEPVEAEVLLFDVTNPDKQRLAALKWELYQHFHLDSQRYEKSWDYEEYCRIADMAYHTLCVLLHPDQVPAVVIAHEFMGMPTALRCSLDRKRFRTVFHAHECSTARRIVEHLPGYDAAFYPAMRRAQADGKLIEDVFGDQSDYARHALVSKTYLLDAILAVGPETAAELKFLSSQMRTSAVRVAYNGLPAPRTDLTKKKASRQGIDAWLSRVVGFVPDYLVTHVTRPVPSKGLWRDIELMSQLCERLKAKGKSAAYVLLTCGGPVRSESDIESMARAYGWPAQHRVGYPDLVGAEVELSSGIERLNERAAAVGAQVRGVLVNQFGFSRQRVGEALDAGLTVDDLRLATDVELGMSTYEPYGIAQLEPLYGGAICLPGSVCGCLGLVQRVMKELGIRPEQCPVVLPADFTREEDLPSVSRAALSSGGQLRDAVHLSAGDRHDIEKRVCARLADELMARLPKSDDERVKLIELGQRLAERMNWDTVTRTDFMPGIETALAN